MLRSSKKNQRYTSSYRTTRMYIRLKRCVKYWLLVLEAIMIGKATPFLIESKKRCSLKKKYKLFTSAKNNDTAVLGSLWNCRLRELMFLGLQLQNIWKIWDCVANWLESLPQRQIQNTHIESCKIFWTENLRLRNPQRFGFQISRIFIPRKVFYI